ncbi:hypothetical protein ACIBCO_36635 [Streptomyces violascens]|uniref:hypothetical protein n=1 Tax=Streptomyces violascens TaxID=67381 RepID=UPI0037AB1872
MHRNIRIVGFTAAGLSAALVLTGCGSSDKKSDPAARSNPAVAPSSRDNTAVQSSDLLGVWTSQGDKDVMLLFTSQKTVTLTGSHFCVGRFDDTANTTTVKMSECNGNYKERNQGTLKLTQDTLEIDWKGFRKESFTHSAKPKLPSSAPTAEPPTS